MYDLTEAEFVEIKVMKIGDTFRVWVNAPEGCVFRAYKVKEVIADEETLAAIKTEGEDHGD
jgi:hypothetical protein